ncbi:hypothetical protein KOW79_017631 [Hemibagrus wyckioides]|uniref:Uncharacterized protein n=1 Tax=Hemibagrus wyckioides TaxID=337641 RepID=A0A9D3NE01_9TELE|nr:hypothetical protein KOW79_017631 [Hemibagrus wyckioides]
MVLRSLRRGDVKATRPVLRVQRFGGRSLELHCNVKLGAESHSSVLVKNPRMKTVRVIAMNPSRRIVP